MELWNMWWPKVLVCFRSVGIVLLEYLESADPVSIGCRCRSCSHMQNVSFFSRERCIAVFFQHGFVACEQACVSLTDTKTHLLTFRRLQIHHAGVGGLSDKFYTCKPVPPAAKACKQQHIIHAFVEMWPSTGKSNNCHEEFTLPPAGDESYICILITSVYVFCYVHTFQINDTFFKETESHCYE